MTRMAFMAPTARQHDRARQLFVRYFHNGFAVTQLPPVSPIGTGGLRKSSSTFRALLFMTRMAFMAPTARQGKAIVRALFP